LEEAVDLSCVWQITDEWMNTLRVDPSRGAVLRRGSAADRLLGLRFQIPLRALICLLWVLCIVRLRSLRGSDSSSRGVLPTVVHHFMWSSNHENEAALAAFGLFCQKGKSMLRDYMKCLEIMFNWKCKSSGIWRRIDGSSEELAATIYNVLLVQSTYSVVFFQELSSGIRLLSPVTGPPTLSV
jgi:hypothetical protein